MSKYNDTIYALSTSTGKSAIDVIRVSGSKSIFILKKISAIKKIKDLAICTNMGGPKGYIILSEVSQRKINTIRFHSYHTKQMNKEKETKKTTLKYRE